jgi:hypothetical protein
MIWHRSPKPDTAVTLDEASARMMEAIASGRGRGMAWIDFLVADAAHEAAEKAAAGEARGASERRTS